MNDNINIERDRKYRNLYENIIYKRNKKITEGICRYLNSRYNYKNASKDEQDKSVLTFKVTINQTVLNFDYKFFIFK